MYKQTLQVLDDATGRSDGLPPHLGIVVLVACGWMAGPGGESTSLEHFG